MDDYNLKVALPLVPDAATEQIIELFEYIDAPSDLRGMHHVVFALESISRMEPHRFTETFEFNADNFKYFSTVAEPFLATYQKPQQAKGWKSSRPIYSLLFGIGVEKNTTFSLPVLNFLNHFYNNENRIKSANREEEAVRAFRLLITDRDFDCTCLYSEDPLVVSKKIEKHRSELMAREGDYSHTINYCRQLEHFYLLNWKERSTRLKMHHTRLSQSYSRSKIERIYGTDDAFTASLKKQPLTIFDEENGLDANEDYPSLLLIKEENETPKSKYELPDTSVLKDKIKQGIKSRNVSNKIKRAHNISPLSRTILQPHELEHLWLSLTKTVRGTIQSVEKTEIQKILMFTLFFGRDLDSIRTLRVISDETADGDGFFKDADSWFLKTSITPTVNRGKHSIDPKLRKNKHYCLIQVPGFLSKKLELNNLEKKALLFLQRKAEIIKSISSYLKSVNKQFNIQLSHKRILYYLTNKLISSYKYDAVLLEVLTGNTSYYTRSMRHYTWRNDEEINDALFRIWKSVFDEINSVNNTIDIPAFHFNSKEISGSGLGVGSEFTPSIEAIRTLTSNLKSKLSFYTPFSAIRGTESVIEYHNQYTVYTAYMLLNATGYRAVNNPLPSFNLNLLRYGLICISDKDSAKNFSHMRVIVAPSILQKQLVNYTKHLKMVGKLLFGIRPQESLNSMSHTKRNPQIELDGKLTKLDWLNDSKHSRRDDGTFVYIKNIDSSSKNIGPAVLKELTDQDLQLPINFGRHYLRTYLQQQNIDQELINFQLGHSVAGELPLGLHSSFEHFSVINILSPILGTMMNELGWEVIESSLTRKRS